LKILALITDAFGGFGGIAVYNRDFLESVCSHDRVQSVRAFPRKITQALEPLPKGLEYHSEASKGIPAFTRAVTLEMLTGPRPDLIYCAHINLTPFATTLRMRWRAPILLGLHGVECWQPTGRRLVDRAARTVDRFFSVSRVTRRRFADWSGVSMNKIDLLPCAVHLESYGIASPSPEVIRRFGLLDRTVILTLGRIVSAERAKGFDEVIDALNTLRARIPDILYVIAGDGDYRSVLEQKVKRLGLSDHVIFTGRVSETEKRELYRAAHAYVMPSRGEGFGFVFLEAMACGTPCVASSIDGSRDAVRDGELGTMVDPSDAGALVSAVLKAVSRPKMIPPGLEYFAYSSFRQRVHSLIDSIGGPPTTSTSMG
jgi:glycosyltransferase involved in cell wall biosynthesis